MKDKNEILIGEFASIDRIKTETPGSSEV